MNKIIFAFITTVYIFFAYKMLFVLIKEEKEIKKKFNAINPSNSFIFLRCLFRGNTYNEIDKDNLVISQ